MVERETYVKNDKTYFSYFVKGTVRGKQVRVSIMPPDRGGYTVLDIVFGNENQATLVVTPFEMKDEKGNVVDKDNKMHKGNNALKNTATFTYTDANGTKHEASVNYTHEARDDKDKMKAGANTSSGITLEENTGSNHGYRIMVNMQVVAKKLIEFFNALAA